MQNADTNYFLTISSTSINEASSEGLTYSRCFVAFVNLFETSGITICQINLYDCTEEIPRVLNSLRKRNAKKKNEEKNHGGRREEVGPS